MAIGPEVLVLFDIAIVLFVAKIFGEVAERLKVDSTVGEIAAGLLLGPILNLVQPNGLLGQLSGLGILVLLFLMGMSTKLEEMKGHVYSGTATAVVAAGASMAGGFAVGYVFFNSVLIGIVLGIAIMSTSTAIPLKILQRTGHFRTPVGQFVVATAMADDLAAILALSLLSAWLATQSIAIGQAVALFFIMIGFIYFLLTAGAKISNAFLHIFQRMRDEQSLFAIALVILFFVSFAAESLGVAAVTGAFLAGMALANSVFTEPAIAPKIKTLGHGLFIPLFFAYSALFVDLSVMLQNWPFVVALVAVAVVTKLIASAVMARVYGYRGKEAGIVALGMIPRGEYEIVIAQLTLGFGVITSAVYGGLIATALITTIITPILFRLYLGRQSQW